MVNNDDRLQKELPRLYNLLVKHLPSGTLPAETVVDAELMHKEVSQILKDLLENDFQQLLQLMYRVDVTQKKFEAAMKQPSLQAIADQLTKLVLMRELEKLRFRNK